jgi:polysaccharide chain length determinant protein (PEP-CTERM system associated)
MNNAVESALGTVQKLLRTAGKRRWLALGVAAGVFVAASLVIAKVPERYEASARVYVDTQKVLKPMMQSMTFQPDLDEQIKLLARTLVSRPNVERLLAMPELQLPASTPEEREATISRLTEQIQISPVSSQNPTLFDITYKGSTAPNARLLVQAVVELFVHSGTSERREDSREAERFIDEQIKDYEQLLTQAETRLKDFKMRNFSVSGVPPQDYFVRVSTLTDEIDRLHSDLGAAERQADAYKRELDGLDNVGATPVDMSSATADLEQRLEAQKRTLDDLLRKDTEAHPDVVGTRHTIAMLEQDIADRRAALQHDPHPTAPAAGSAVYQRLRVAYADAQSQAAGLRSKLSSAEARLSAVRSEASRGPEVEAELAQLNRDYDVIRKNYDTMVARRESALLGAKLDQQSQLADFRVIDPARASSSPVFPARLHLELIALIASLLIGVLVALAADLLAPTVDDSQVLRTLIDRPVIGSISLSVSPQMRQRKRADLLRFGAAAASVVLFQASWIAWTVLRPYLG